MQYYDVWRENKGGGFHLVNGKKSGKFQTKKEKRKYCDKKA